MRLQRYQILGCGGSEKERNRADIGVFTECEI